MSAEETEQKVDERTNDEGGEPEPEPEKKEQREEEPPRITNDNVETDPVRKVVNKKLSTMSKESKEGKKNRKRVLKPLKDEFKISGHKSNVSINIHWPYHCRGLFVLHKENRNERRGRGRH